MKKILAFILIPVSLVTFGQSGKDGTITISAPNTVVNKYSPVVANIAPNSSTVAIMTSSFASLCAGDLIMVYQAQGAITNTANVFFYGSITAYNSAGLYEFKYVKSITGNTINIQGAFLNGYATIGKVQVVKVPQPSMLTINSGAAVTAGEWRDTLVSGTNYRFGGIVAISAGTVINNGSISANGAGFRGGGAGAQNSAGQGMSDFVSLYPSDGGEKGESISGYAPEYDLAGGRYCRGSAANGGGGGDGHNSGGGGGANGHSSHSWNGIGVMVVTANSPLSAWALDPDYIANGNALTNSSGGGRGGYSWGDANANATVSGPGNASWGGDSRRNIGGLGGRPLININAASRIYFGGGGGAASANNNATFDGADGGGIVYLVASARISGSGRISSNGNTALNTGSCSCDGASGGGAGGSIVIRTPTIAVTQTISATGGKGGDQLFIYPLYSNVYASTPDENDGPGGGGGGGFVAISAPGITPLINGGANGISLSPGVTEMLANGATEGAAGETGTVASTFISFVPIIVTLTANSPVCAGGTLSLTSSEQNVSYQWLGPNGFSSGIQNPNITSAGISASGIYTLNISSPGCPVFATATMSVTVKTCTGIEELTNAAHKLNVYPNPNAGDFTIDLNKNIKMGTVEVYDSSNRLVYRSEFSSDNKVKLKNQPAGIYMIRVLENGRNIGQERIVIQPE